MGEEKENFEELLKNMEQPVVDTGNYQREFRLSLLNTRKSALVGLLLLVLPFLFLIGVVFSHYLQIEVPAITSLYHWISDLDERYGDHSPLNWIFRILLTVGPLVAILLNLMAVTHIRFESKPPELILSFKLRWLNWLIILACTTVFSVFFLYLLIENF